MWLGGIASCVRIDIAGITHICPQHSVRGVASQPLVEMPGNEEQESKDSNDGIRGKDIGKKHIFPFQHTAETDEDSDKEDKRF
ncbi:hypothetical protein E2C01_076929 [Portunus trituberculatus]|uniref:Uncharacterized protein n=1 Tax=Portunus trituberculatus TaxID=210409 RepID=A0A5B7IEF6_PORTR|nr:hypothetical protein [Portunus trituberculatus]